MFIAAIGHGTHGVWPFREEQDPISTFNPRNYQVGKGGLPPLHLASLKLTGERGRATLPDLRVSDDRRTRTNFLLPKAQSKMAKLQRPPSGGPCL